MFPNGGLITARNPKSTGPRQRHAQCSRIREQCDNFPFAAFCAKTDGELMGRRGIVHTFLAIRSPQEHLN